MAIAGPKPSPLGVAVYQARVVQHLVRGAILNPAGSVPKPAFIRKKNKKNPPGVRIDMAVISMLHSKSG